MMDNLAAALWDARQNGTALPRDAASGLGSRAEAYAVQADIMGMSGKSCAGWKIAATSEFAQDLLAVPGPSLGPIFMEDIYESGVTLSATSAHSTAVECELAFVMGTGLEGRENLSREDVVAATELVLIAIEVVGCRFEGGFKDIGEICSISDCSMNEALVRGAVIVDGFDASLIAAEAAVLVNGEVVNKGTGAAVLGDPIEALCWAANEAALISQPLRAGDIISTGTMTGAMVVNPGDKVVGDFGLLGTVEVNF